MIDNDRPHGVEAGLDADALRAAGRQSPFARAFEPLVRRGLGPLDETVLGHDTVPSVVASIADDLADLAGDVLLDGFARARWRRSIAADATGDHDRFLSDLEGGGLAALLSSLPALSALVERRMTERVAATHDLVRRLRGDAPVLSERFGFEFPIRAFRGLVGGAAALESDAGVSIVYKDRPVDMDAAFAELVSWLDRVVRGDLRAPLIIERGGYGYMEFVPHRPPVDTAARDRYLRSSGTLLALATLLGSADLHVGNIHIDDDRPVVLDAEVMLRPRRSRTATEPPSPAHTGWLALGGYVEPSGLAAGFRRVEPGPWTAVGTDAVRRRPQTAARYRARQRVAAGLAEWPRSAIDALCDGYRSGYRAICRTDPPLDLFVATRPRVILRPSRHYDAAIAESLRPATLAGGDARRREAIADILSAAPPSLPDAAIGSAVVRAERVTVFAAHYPRFTMPAGGGPLALAGDEVAEISWCAPLERAHRMVRAASERDIDHHVEVIRAGIASAALGS